VTVSEAIPVVNTTDCVSLGLVGGPRREGTALNGRSFDNLITLESRAINYTLGKKPQIPAPVTATRFQWRAVGRPIIFPAERIEYTVRASSP